MLSTIPEDYEDKIGSDMYEQGDYSASQVSGDGSNPGNISRKVTGKRDYADASGGLQVVEETEDDVRGSELPPTFNNPIS